MIVSDRYHPTSIKALALAKALKKKLFTRVSAGSEHSVALTDSGEVYTWGGDPEGQLGLGGTTGESQVQVTPHLVLSLSKFKITKIAAGGAHTLALTGINE